MGRAPPLPGLWLPAVWAPHQPFLEVGAWYHVASRTFSPCKGQVPWAAGWGSGREVVEGPEVCASPPWLPFLLIPEYP